MIILHLYRGAIDGDPRGVVQKIVSALPDPFQPVLRPALATQLEVLGLASGSNSRPRRLRHRDIDWPSDVPATDGEIVVAGNCLYILTVREPRRARHMQRHLFAPEDEGAPDKPYLELAVISPHTEGYVVEEVLRVVSEQAAISLVPREYRSGRFEELKAEGRESPASPSHEELAAARVLREKSARTLAVAIKAAGGLLLRDLPKQLPAEHRDRTDALLRDLRESGIVDAETVIVCSKTQAQIARTQSPEILAELSQRGLRCSCGRPLGDERIEEALTLTEIGRSLVEKSRWLTLLLIAELRRAGVPLDSILIDQQMGGDEIDCLANISGELVLFELKDKEFNLGNAYSFGAKIGIIRPQHSVIVSTEHVGNDAKEHFQRAGLVGGPQQRRFLGDEARSSDVQYIEGLPSLSPGIDALAKRVYAADALRLIAEVLGFGLIEPDRVLSIVECSDETSAATSDRAQERTVGS